jgi:hypothetical protein
MRRGKPTTYTAALLHSCTSLYSATLRLGRDVLGTRDPYFLFCLTLSDSDSCHAASVVGIVTSNCITHTQARNVGEVPRNTLDAS